MTALFFSKKKKNEMKTRRKRKILAQKESGEYVIPSKKQKREEILDVVESNEPDIIIIPKDLSGKELRKFRKDARRKARENGQDESTVTFAVEGQEEEKNTAATKKWKSTKVYPRINDLLKEQQDEKVRVDEERVRKEADDALPEDYKSRFVALDCEMVGIGTDGKQSVLARATLTDWDGNVIYDSHVQVPTRVTDFRTHVSGIKPKHIRKKSATDPNKCRNEVAALMKGKFLVGHALHNDLKALLLQHPKDETRDTAKHRPFQRVVGSKYRPRKLRDLVKQHLGRDIQIAGESHDSAEDAIAAMELFKLFRESWEKELNEKWKSSGKKGKKINSRPFGVCGDVSQRVITS